MQALGAAIRTGEASPPTGQIPFAETVNLPGFVMGFSRNEEIFGEEESADFVYKVIAGAVRIIRILSDGRRQVAAFHLADDVFGLERGPIHRATAEAVGDCQVALIRRSHLLRAANTDLRTAHALWMLAANDLERVEEHMLMLGRKCASERVAAFLLEMSDRAGGADELELAMCRTDIADYLGLTIETVSRSLTQFERDGVIGLPTCRRVVLKRRAALEG